MLLPILYHFSVFLVSRQGCNQCCNPQGALRRLKLHPTVPFCHQQQSDFPSERPAHVKGLGVFFFLLTKDAKRIGQFLTIRAF
jgi:hypothetical protein